LSGLARGDGFPDDEVVREYVIGLAKATDEANEYEQATLEHRALAELVGALTAPGESGGLR
jgi:anti-sigma-K factor RskA